MRTFNDKNNKSNINCREKQIRQKALKLIWSGAKKTEGENDDDKKMVLDFGSRKRANRNNISSNLQNVIYGDIRHRNRAYFLELAELNNITCMGTRANVLLFESDRRQSAHSHACMLIYLGDFEF